MRSSERLQVVLAEDAVTCEPFSALKQRIIQGRSALHAADAPKIPLDLAICANTTIIDQGNNRQSDAAFLIWGKRVPAWDSLAPKPWPFAIPRITSV
jgi:hypothetical protein